MRGNRKIALTEEGIILRKRAEEILALVEKDSSEIMVSDEDISSDVYIGDGETEGRRVIAHAVKKTQALYPKIHFHIFSENAYDVIERLDKGLLDFGTLIEPIELNKYDCLHGKTCMYTSL